MKILYVSSEAAPYAASGGLGDVMGALPKSITACDNSISAEVIIPLYDSIRQIYRNRFEKVIDISFNLSWRSTGATVYKLSENNVTYYFVENHYYFERGRLYGEWDDGERFAFFSTAVIEFMLATNNIPDVLHANDWQTALTVIYLKTKYKDNKKLSSIKTLYTIHNIEYQGKYDSAILGDVFALDEKFLPSVEYDGCINLMKGAITLSDYVSTVSPNYAHELKHSFFAFGLQDIIKANGNKLVGVINGIDYSYFSPDKGGEIYASYSKARIPSGKAKNKTALQREIGLTVSEKTPLIAMITRLTDGKGIDLVTHIIDELLAENVQLVILGTGDAKYEQLLASKSKEHNNFRALIKFDRALSKKIYAAADIFLMPSKSEPCGLAQMIATSYATIPVVRAVGGLFDTIKPYGDENSNGFTFNNYNAHELLFTLKNAINLYKNTQEWQKLRLRAINSDFSWNNSAAKYIAIYKNLFN